MGLKVTNFHTFKHSFCSVVLVVNHSGVQPSTQTKISGVHLPYFRSWKKRGKQENAGMAEPGFTVNGTIRGWKKQSWGKSKELTDSLGASLRGHQQTIFVTVN